MKSGPVSSHKEGQAENLVRMEAALDELAGVHTQQDAWTGGLGFQARATNACLLSLENPIREDLGVLNVSLVMGKPPPALQITRVYYNSTEILLFEKDMRQPVLADLLQFVRRTLANIDVGVSKVALVY
jgi:hypothetical protein